METKKTKHYKLLYLNTILTIAFISSIVIPIVLLHKEYNNNYLTIVHDYIKDICKPLIYVCGAFWLAEAGWIFHIKVKPLEKIKNKFKRSELEGKNNVK